MPAGVRFDLRSVDGHTAQLDQTAALGDQNDLLEQLYELLKVLLPKVADRPMLRKVPRCQHSERHVLFDLLRDPSRRERSRRIPIDQDLEHHRWVKGLVPPRIALFVSPVQPAQIHLVHHFGDEERQVLFREPVTRRRRQQVALLRLVRSVVARHASSYRHPPFSTAFALSAAHPPRRRPRSHPALRHPPGQPQRVCTAAGTAITATRQ